MAAWSIWKSRPVKLAGVAPLAVVSHVVSTCPKSMSGLALTASTVAWAWLNPTVMIELQPWSMSRWMFAA